MSIARLIVEIFFLGLSVGLIMSYFLHKWWVKGIHYVKGLFTK